MPYIQIPLKSSTDCISSSDINSIINNMNMLHDNKHPDVQLSCKGCGAPRYVEQQYCQYCGR